METTPWIELLLIAVAILINGFFAGSEIALVSSRISSLAEMRQKGVRGAATAFRLKESPQAFLATIQIAITLVGALASAVGGGAPRGAGLPRAFASVVRVLTASTNVVLRLLGQGKAQESPFISEEEVKY